MDNVIDTGLVCSEEKRVDDQIRCAHCDRLLKSLRFAFNYRKLRREPYFKSPEGRAVLEMLQRRYPRDPRVQNWLLREYRRGRLTVSPQWAEHIRGLVDAEQNGDEQGIEHWNSVLDDPNRPDVVLWHPNPEGGHPTPVQPGIVQGIGQMMNRGVGGKGVDLMNHTFGDFLPKYEQWNAEQRKRDPNSGQVVHSFPNGWTMRRLQNKDEAYDEGEVMQNCVPKFAPSVEDGGVHIFSLRDPKNNPHVNVLMQPGSDGHWSTGYVRDIRGKQNDRPMDEYRNMVRSWFDTFDPKPPVQFDPTPPGMAQHPGHPEDYGLEDMNYRQANWQFDSAWDGFIVEANFNKVRNMLRKNNQLTPQNDIVNEIFRKTFGHDWDQRTREYTPHTHADPYAEWLHREFRKGRIYPGVNVANYEQNQQDLAHQLEQIKESYPEQLASVQEILDDPDRAEALSQYGGQDYNRLWNDIGSRLTENLAYYLQNIRSWEKYKNDPRANGLEPKVIKTDGGYEKIDEEALKHFPKILQRRKDKGLEANISKIFANQYPEAADPDYTGPKHIFEEAKQEAQLDKLLKHGGVVEHEFPDGWTMRRINDADAARLEGEMMGHCIGQYADRVTNGTSLNYSLRDPRGFPHATFEIVPRRPMRVDWDAAERDPEAIALAKGERAEQGPTDHRPRTCGVCEGPLTRDGVCPRCNPGFNPASPLDNIRKNYEKEQNGEDIRYEISPEELNQHRAFKTLGIKNGWLAPDPRGGDASQIQGKGNVAPEPKYHKYIREWADTFPYEDRPKSSWRNYFVPKDAMYPEQLPDVLKKVDEFGFQAPNRSVDWKAMVKGLDGQSPQWANPSSQSKQFKAPTQPEEGYDPNIGQQVYDFARQNGHLIPFYKAVNDASTGTNSNGGCPNCGVGPERGRADYYDYGHTYCRSCGGNYPTDEWSGSNPRSPYTGQMVSHLGNLFAQHPELQNYAAHDAPNIIKPTCPDCGGQIGTCKACPGTDHGVCENCGGYYQYPGHQPEGGGMPGVQASWHFAGADCPHLRNTRWPVAHIGANGEECYCLWNPASSGGGDVDPKVGKSAGAVKTADKLNGFLRSPQARPDLQTPEAQEFLNHLEQYYHNPQTDALMPWVVREWKKGRANYVPSAAQSLSAQSNPDGNLFGVSPARFTHWGEWYNSNHPTRQGVDLMQLKTHDLQNKVNEWDEDMKKQMGDRAENMGQVVHRWPDGWTVQRLLEDKHLKEEGEAMGHCVGGYGARVRNGDSLIYSFRDQNNEPHVTMEVEPHYDEGRHCTVDGCDERPKRGDTYDWICLNHGNTIDVKPHNGRMVQIQGKANEAPIPEYQQRVKDWVEATFPEEEDRPEWDDQDIDNVDDWHDGPGGGYTEYHKGDYGLNEPHYNFDWDSILENAHSPYHDYGESHPAADVVEIANDSPDPDRELRILKEELQTWYDAAIRSFREDFDYQYDDDPERFLANRGYEFDEERPSEEDFIDDEGEVNEDEWQDALNDWEERRQEWCDSMKEDIMEDAWGNDERNTWYDELNWAVQNAIARRRHGKNLNRHHAHFSTGLPCRCRFTAHLRNPVFAASVPVCDVCGDPLEDGVSCKRCEWGGWSNPASDQNPPDPFRDLKGPFQSKVANNYPCPNRDGILQLDQDGDWRCPECNSVWADAGGRPDVGAAPKDIDPEDEFGFGEQGAQDWDDTFNAWNMKQQAPQLPNPQNVLPTAPNTAPQFIDPAQREQVIYNTLQEAWDDLKADPWEGSIATIGEVLPGELVQKGVAPDIAQEVAQEWEQKAQEWYSQGQTNLTVPKEWTARIATYYATRPSTPESRWDY